MLRKAAEEGGGVTVADSAVAVKERGLEAESTELQRKKEDQTLVMIFDWDARC